MREGWQCPVCGKVWSPTWPGCDCGGNRNHSITTTGTTVCAHEWEEVNETAASHRCRLCGVTKVVF